MITADAVVIGGGAVGCSLVYHLSERGVRAILLERAQLGSQSTGRCAGGVRQQFSTEINVRIQLESVRMLKAFEEEIGASCDFRQIGYLFALTSPQHVDEFHRLIEMWHRVGLMDACWISADEAARINPVLNVIDVLGCTFCPSDGLASPADMTQGYAHAARRHGARLLEGVEVTGIEVLGGRIAGVRTSEGRISTGAVFICAGAWSAEAGRMASIDIPVVPFRRHIFVTNKVPGVTGTMPMTVDFATSFYFHPEGEGVLFGMGDPDETTSFNTDTDWTILEKIAKVVTHRAPALERAQVTTGWAGLYEMSPDNQAILGPVDEISGLWCACGFSGHGFMQAPAAGKLLARKFLDEKSDIDLTPLSLTRFKGGPTVSERNVI
jgi:sarcosine oxidase subunit beta